MNNRLDAGKPKDDGCRDRGTVDPLSHDQPKRKRRENDRQHETDQVILEAAGVRGAVRVM